MVTVEYNGTNPFTGLAPTPFIGRGLSMIGENERWGIKDSLSLEGVITGDCGSGFAGNYAKYESLVNRFSENFKEFKVIDEGSVIYQSPVANVTNINIGKEGWRGVIPFTISLDCYRSGTFSGQYGISSAENKVSYSEEEDCTVTISHELNAVGFQTTNTAADNAKNYVSSISGWAGQVSPHFIDNNGYNTPVLVSSSESVNRLGGTYTLINNYVYDPKARMDTSSGVLKYTVDYQQGDSDASVALQGKLLGGKTHDINALRSAFSGINFYAIASGDYKNYATGVLNPNPTEFGVNENDQANEIDFSIAYSNTDSGVHFFEDKTTINRDLIRQLSSITVGDSMGTKSVCAPGSWENLKQYYEDFDIPAYIDQQWAEYGDGTQLIKKPTSQSYGENEIEKKIDFSLTYSNNPELYDDEYLENFDYTMQFNPSIVEYVDVPTLDGEGSRQIWDLGFRRRANYSLNGSARVRDCWTISEGEAQLKSRLNELSSKYFTGSRKVLARQNISYGANRILNFNVTWTAEGPTVI